MNIYQKIAEVMKDVQYLCKDGHVQFGTTDYKAVSEEKVTSAVRESLLKNGMVIVPIEQLHHREGTLSTVDVSYRIQNIEDIEDFIIAKSSGTGADTQDKGVGKAMTYAYKYLLLRTFAIPTGNDPDKISSDELDDKDIEAAKKYISKADQETLRNEILRVGGSVKEWVDYVSSQVKTGAKPASIEYITPEQYVWSLKILKTRPQKVVSA